MEFKLLTNGMIEGYPKTIYGKTFRVKHWTDLSLSVNETEFDVLVDCLDDVIDFTKTESIKSSNELTQEDLRYLFLQQYLNCKGEEFNISYTCSKDEQKTPYKLSLIKDVKEEQIRDRIKIKVEEMLKDGDENIPINIKLARYKDLKFFEGKLKEYKTKFDNMTEDQLKEVSKEFNPELLNIMIYFPYIDKDFNSIDEYLEWFNNQDGRIFKILDNYIAKCYHSLTCEKKFKCKNCGSEEVLEVPMELSFFRS